MFFLLSKTLPYLFMPLTIIIGVLLFSLFLNNRKWKNRLQICAVGLLLICSNHFVADQVFKLWEVPPTPIGQLPNSRTVGIVLSGVVKKEKLPHDRVYLAEGADRITHAIQLYKAGKIQKIVITGGQGAFSKSSIREAPQLRQVLIMCEVPEEDIIIESESRNTRQNAVFTAEILKKQFPDYHYLLITSSFHMRRSLACFKKAGISTDGFSTDFKTGDYPPRFTAYFIPSPNAIDKWHLLMKELMGVAAYKAMGYI